MRKFSTALACLALISACTTSSLTDLESAPVPETTAPFSGQVKEIDKEQSVISFTGKSNIVNHEGKFTEYDATVTLDSTEPENLEKAVITAEVSIASIVTDSDRLQGHLQKDDFFSAEQYPKATFVSTSIVAKGGNQYEITGDLSVKGMTKTIAVMAEITDAYLTAHYDLPRKEFGIGNDSYGDKLLEETVPVDVKLVFKQ